MHEMSLVHDLVDVVLAESQKNGIAEVGTVHLTIGARHRGRLSRRSL